MEKDECNGGWLGVVEVGRERLSLVGYGRVWLGVVKFGRCGQAWLDVVDSGGL